MKKTSKKTKKKKVSKAKNAKIPSDLVNKFLEGKIKASDTPRVRDIKQTNLWDNRYRINVWLEQLDEGQYCPRIWIEYSYFVHFVDNKIIDKTIPPKPKEEKIF